MISEWMDEGNINEFVKRRRGVNRLQLVSYGFTPGYVKIVMTNQCS